MWTFEGRFGTIEQVNKPHIAAASEGAANTVQKPKPQATQERVIYV